MYEHQGKPEILVRESKIHFFLWLKKSAWQEQHEPEHDDIFES